jgi:hypothetical protein
VTLEIDAWWRDAAGALLAEPFAKTVTVAPPLRAPIDPGEWRIAAPAGLGSPLAVDFPQPLDAALALRALAVWRGGTQVAGAARLEAVETRWVFTPEQPWAPGRHTLRADAVLEDIAGNRIGRPFDIDRHAPAGRDAAAHGAEVAFDVFPSPLAGEGVAGGDG